MSEVKTGAQMLAEVQARFAPPNVEADQAARERRMDDAEQSEMGQADAGGVLEPVSSPVMRGFGEDGPHRFVVPYEEQKRDRHGNPVLDESGDPVYEQNVFRLRIGPVGIGNMLLFADEIRKISQETQQIMVAWSLQKGEGPLDPAVCAAKLEEIYPRWIAHPQTGERIDIRDPFTGNMVEAMLNGSANGLTKASLAAMEEAILIAFEGYDSRVDGPFYRKHFTYALACQCLGKILALNGPFHKRFLA